MRLAHVLSASTSVACATATAALPLVSPVAGAATTTKFPSWVKPGLEVEYAEDLGGYVDYDYTDTVTSMSKGAVDISTYRWSPGLPGTGKDTTWSCAPVCTGLPASLSAQFWVDTTSPAASLGGGAWHYKYMGVVNYTSQGKKWRAGLLYTPTAHGPVVSYFQASTGLVIYHKEYAYSLQYRLWYTIQISYVGTLKA